MQDSNSKNKLRNLCPSALTTIGVSSCILLVTAGVLVLSSCATTRKGLDREQQLYLVTSNAVSGITALTPFVPAPFGTLLEGATAVGGALLAVWASHLHRSVRALENGPPKRPATPTTGPPSPQPS